MSSIITICSWSEPNLPPAPEAYPVIIQNIAENWRILSPILILVRVQSVPLALVAALQLELEAGRRQIYARYSSSILVRSTLTESLMAREKFVTGLTILVDPPRMGAAVAAVSTVPNGSWKERELRAKHFLLAADVVSAVVEGTRHH